MNPIEILWCWQALLVALVAAGMTQFVKTAVDIFWGKVAPETTTSLKDMAEIGKGRRKANIALNRLIFPSLPVQIGALLAALAPIRPDVLTEFVAKNPAGWNNYIIYAAWGATCGMFSSYVFDKAKALLGDAMKGRAAGSE